MDYLRKQQLQAEADAIRPGLGTELFSRFHVTTSAELDELQALIEEHKQVVMSSMEAVIANNRRQADEYRRQTALLEAKVASSGVSQLPGAGLDAARHLAAVAGRLGLHTASEGAMVAAWVAEEAEKLRQERLQVQRESVAHDLRSAAQTAARQAAEVAAALDAARRSQAVAERGLESTEAEQRTLEAKAEEYVRRIEAMRSKLVQLGYRPELGHEALGTLAAEVESLEAQLAGATEALKMYDGIPPSAPGLTAMLERSQRELAEQQAAMGSAFVHGGKAQA
ncbi:hypothetical protein Agub_g2356, partial [Astrephomene gubernaculifera]